MSTSEGGLNANRVFCDVHISVLGNKVHVGHHLCLRHRKDKIPNCTKSFRKHALFLYIHIIKYIYNISIMPLSLRIMCFLKNVFN